MLYVVDFLVEFFDGHLLRPLAAVIDAAIAAVYYFLWVSYFIGYCLVEGSTRVWNCLTGAASEVNRLYCDMCYNTQDATKYFYGGACSGLRNVRDLGLSIGQSFCDLLIELGDGMVWLSLLLPRIMVYILDCVVEFVMDSIVTRGLSLLNSVFRLSIGLSLLLVLYMFRRYVSLVLNYMYERTRFEISTKAQSLYRWTDQQLTRLIEILRNDLENDSPPRGGFCVICMDRGRNIVILPCRHLCLCKECSQLLLLRFENRCPVCRNAIASFLPVFV